MAAVVLLNAVLLPSVLPSLVTAFREKCPAGRDDLLRPVAPISRESFRAAPEEGPSARELFQSVENRVLVVQAGAYSEVGPVRVVRAFFAVPPVGPSVPVLGT